MTTNPSGADALCPCGSGEPFDTCCGPIIDGVPAPTAVALMRARYSAFATRRIGVFLVDTLAPEKMSAFNLREVELSARDAEGLGIEILTVADGGGEDEEGTVEYVARFRIRGQEQIHHELATFRREDGRWLYVDGRVNPVSAPRRGVSVGRNDPCPCDSGRKFKKCCGF